MKQKSKHRKLCGVPFELITTERSNPANLRLSQRWTGCGHKPQAPESVARCACACGLDYQSWPIVFVAAPKVVRELLTPAGNPRLFQFTVHRLGRGTNDLTVYLNFHSPNGIPVQGGVTIPAGARIGTTIWLLRDNGVKDGPRHFSASISLSAVRQQLPGARYKLHGPWPYAATVLILDPAQRDR